MLLNGKITLDWSRAFAGRVLREAGQDPREGVERVYQVALGRPPSTREMQLGLDFLDQQAQHLRQRLANKQAILAPTGAPAQTEPAFGGAVVDLCHVLLNVNEFAY